MMTIVCYLDTQCDTRDYNTNCIGAEHVIMIVIVLALLMISYWPMQTFHFMTHLLRAQSEFQITLASKLIDKNLIQALGLMPLIQSYLTYKGKL